MISAFAPGSLREALSSTTLAGIGLVHTMGPTGGIRLGFYFATVVAGWFAERGWDRSPFTAITAAVIAGAVIYAPGLLWLVCLIGFDKSVLSLGLYPFILAYLVKAVLAAIIFPAAWRLAEPRSRH